MKHMLVLSLAAAVCATGISSISTGQDVKLETNKDKVAYGIGQRIGNDLKREGTDFDPALIARGIADAMAGKKPALTPEQFAAAAKALQEEKTNANKAVGDKNKATGEAFLAKNKTAPGVKTTASGLQYKVIKAGAGATPKATDTVKTHYRGTLINGKEFDSSYKRGQPATFPVGRVIDGWTEALQLMKVGDKWQLFIPHTLAYGEQGAGGDIGPNETLIFEIELLGIEAPAQPQ